MGQILLAKEPCLICPSSDAMHIYDDGAICYSCYGNIPAELVREHYGDMGQMETKAVKKEKPKEFVEGITANMSKRGISKDTADLYAVEYNKDTQQIVFNHYNEGERVGQKVRDLNKDFFSLGKLDTLYGKWLWKKPKQKTMIITEGEIDALSVWEATAGSYAVTSIANGAQSSKKAIQDNLSWLEKNFERIILMFDNDDAGEKAIEDCISLFDAGKAYTVDLGEFKDANEVICSEDGEDLLRQIIIDASAHRPPNIISITEAWGMADQVPKKGLSSPFPTLDDWVSGIRLNEFIVLGAGTGVGKTSLYKEFIIHLRKEHDKKCGIIFLEEPVGDTVKSLVSKVVQEDVRHKLLNEPIEEVPEEERVPIEVVSKDKIAAARKILVKDDNDPAITFYNQFGHAAYEVIEDAINYMVKQKECEYIFLDHLTALVSGDMENDERKMLDYICTRLASLVTDRNFTIFAISHLATAEGKPHEEGGRVFIKHLRGSRAIGQWAHQIWALEKDQQDPNEKNFVNLRILKERYTGQATGKVLRLRYDPDTIKLTEVGDVTHGEIPSPNDEPAF